MTNANLPSGWIADKLANLIEPRGEKVAPSDFPQYRFIGMDHVESATTRIIGSIPASEMKSTAARFRAGDVLYGRLRPYLNKVAQPTFDGVASAEFMVFPDTELVRSAFLKYRLNAADFVNFASHLNEGDRPRVSFDQIGEFDILLPGPLEQVRIVAKIEELFSELDDGIESLETAREQLRVYRQAVLMRAFEGALTADWRSKNSNKLRRAELLRRQLLAARRTVWEKKQTKRYKEPASLDSTNLPPLPPEWSWLSLDELVSGEPRSLQSGPFGSNLKHSEFREQGVLVIGIDNVGDGVFSMGSKNRISAAKFGELQKYQARPGDLLITVMASLGRTCVVPRDLEPAIITKHVYRITMNDEFLLPEFYNLVLQSPTISRRRMLQSAQGQTRPGLNGSILRDIPVPFCSREEQREIVARLDEALSSIDRLDAAVADELQRADALRLSIFKNAFSGRLVAQNPKDESAAALLERIKAKKPEKENEKKKNGRRKAA